MRTTRVALRTVGQPSQRAICSGAGLSLIAAADNRVLRVAPGHLDRNLVQTARRRLEGVPWRWWTGPDSDPGLPGLLHDCGAEVSYTAPKMAVDLDRFAGWLDERIVGSAVLLDHCGVAGIYAVTTVDGYRRRGIGAALTAAALRAGRERGRRVGTLQASSMGRPVYRRMGFQVVAGYRVFTLPTAR